MKNNLRGTPFSTQINNRLRAVNKIGSIRPNNRPRLKASTSIILTMCRKNQQCMKNLWVKNRPIHLEQDRLRKSTTKLNRIWQIVKFKKPNMDFSCSRKKWSGMEWAERRTIDQHQIKNHHKILSIWKKHHRNRKNIMVMITKSKNQPLRSIKRSPSINLPKRLLQCLLSPSKTANQSEDLLKMINTSTQTKKNLSIQIKISWQFFKDKWQKSSQKVSLNLYRKHLNNQQWCPPKTNR